MNYIKECYLRYREIINYLIMGVLTTVVSLASYYACVLTFLNPNDAVQLQAANVISWVVSATFAYLTNRRFVFESKNQNIIKEASAFYLSRLGTLVMDMMIMFVTVTVFRMNDKIAKLIVQVIVVIANYVLSKFFVFQK
ncbi:MAG: GtrA family protein [Lachnospiraceae bacterium]|nr:GtrA family protein [Lachnospiraceae bacterium]